MSQSTAAAAAAVNHQTIHPPPPPPPPTARSTYTTIPISAGDVISRSLQNLTTTISRHQRPWPELISPQGSITRPESTSSALTRLRANSKRFVINYSIVITTCAALSLLGSPISLIVMALVFALWLLLYFFREDPLVLIGHCHVGDWVVLAGLVLVSLLGVWICGCFWSLVVGVGVGALVCGVHAVLRNADDGSVVDSPRDSNAPLIGSRSSDYGAVSPSDRDQFTI